MKRYEELLNEHYKEPIAVNGLFVDVTTLCSAPDESESDVQVTVALGAFENYSFYLLVSCKELSEFGHLAEIR